MLVCAIQRIYSLVLLSFYIYMYGIRGNVYHDVIDILLLHISGCIDPPGTGIYLSTQYMGGGPKKMRGGR